LDSRSEVLSARVIAGERKGPHAKHGVGEVGQRPVNPDTISVIHTLTSPLLRNGSLPHMG